MNGRDQESGQRGEASGERERGQLPTYVAETVQALYQKSDRRQSAIVVLMPQDGTCSVLAAPDLGASSSVRNRNARR
jgi:hypothetical protein